MGEYISALSNCAALENHEFGYLIWGVEDSSHRIVGTKFNPASAKKGNEELEAWLSRMCKPRVSLRFYSLEMQDVNMVVLEIGKAASQPTSFAGVEWIRVGSNTKPLKEYPEKERLLWSTLSSSHRESEDAKSGLTITEALSFLDPISYYRLGHISSPMPENELAKTFVAERFLRMSDDGSYSITVMGALLFANNLYDFEELGDKAIRVISHPSPQVTLASGEEDFHKGYAAEFEEIVRYIYGIQSKKEDISSPFRVDKGSFPIAIIRELVSNCMIHQDLLSYGAGPLIDLYPGKIEASNPGKLLIDPDRIIDAVPICRNELMARYLRRVRICEDRGSGFDRIEEALALLKMPSPKVETSQESTKTSIYYRDGFSSWTESDVIRTVYLFVCYAHLNEEIHANNSSIRERLGIAKNNAAIVSRAIKKAIEAKLIKEAPFSTGARNREYWPYWA